MPGRTARLDSGGNRWFRHALDGMGRWKWAGVAAVMTVLTLLPATAMHEPVGEPRRGPEGSRDRIS